MESASILQTIAEIAIALAGFGGIAAGLGYRARGEWSVEDRLRLLFMVLISLLVVFSCLLPYVIYHLGAQAPWRPASATLLAFQLVNLTAFVWVMRRGVPQGYSRIAAALVLLVQLATVSVLAVASTGDAPASQSGLYLSGVVLLLLNASILFVRLLLTSFRTSTSAA